MPILQLNNIGDISAYKKRSMKWICAQTFDLGLGTLNHFEETTFFNESDCC